MKKSINAWAVDDKIGYGEMFRQLKAAGFEGVELNVDSEGHSAHSLTLLTTENELKGIRELSEQHSLPVVSISSSLYGGKMGSRDKSQREYTKNILTKQLECAKALGCGGILVVPGGGSPQISISEDDINSSETLESMKVLIEETKIYVGVENVWNGFFTSPYHMAEFIDRRQCEYIGAYFDVGNVIAFSWPEFWIEILGRRIHNVHIKDFKLMGGLNRGGEFADLLKGDVNWKAVIPALKKAGFNGYLTAEVFKNDPGMSYEDFYGAVSAAIDVIVTEN